MFESLEFQRKVEQGYKKFTDRGISDKTYMSLKGGNLPNRWVNMDLSALPSIEEVHQRIIGMVAKY